ncbi:MAG: hypothetical protein GTN36_00560 [Candidatus Aenigmarchaeota archaeon]|nr:hypothetical protein [Candidatus Aenigmarchaeota archaeon]
MIQVNEQLRQLNSELIGKAIHYITLENWEKSASSGRLVPHTSIAPEFMRGLPEWAYKKHIFAISLNELKKWEENKRFPDIMNKLMLYIRVKSPIRIPGKKCEIAELSFDIKTSDESHVLDYACRANSLYENTLLKKCKEILQGHYFGPTKEWKNYIDSRIPFLDYKGDYSLPEIAFETPIDSDRIRIERVFD